MMTRRTNPKALTNADRILSVSEKLRRHLITQNRLGVGVKPLAKANGIPDRTVRAIIWDSKRPDAETAPRPKPRLVGLEWETVISPGWERHGELTAVQARRTPG